MYTARGGIHIAVLCPRFFDVNFLNLMKMFFVTYNKLTTRLNCDKLENNSSCRPTIIITFCKLYIANVLCMLSLVSGCIAMRSIRRGLLL